MRPLVVLAALALGAVAAPSGAFSAPADGDPEAGRGYALRHCAGCHNVISREPAPFPPRLGPSFAAVANEKTTTALGLSVFLQTPHASMPNLILSEQERRDVIAHILTLKATHRGDGT